MNTYSTPRDFMSQVQTMKLAHSIKSACCFTLVLDAHFAKSYSENQIGA